MYDLYPIPMQWSLLDINDDIEYFSKCIWVLIVACCLAPLCMFGSPADFWFVAVGALVSTVVGCIIVLVKVFLDPLFKYIDS